MARFEDYSVEEWNEIARRMAAERLPHVNENVAEVVPANNIYLRYGKRVLDIAIATTAIAITLPLNIVFAICTYIDIGNPILFKQTRIGKDGKKFKLVKFRNMTNETDVNGNLLPASQRITKFGSFMRRTSMDELLNFLSILKGDMSVIGPRPLVPEYVERYNKRHSYRMAVRPGLECPPRKLNEYWSWQEQLENDIWYVENVSFFTDIYMIWRLFLYAFDKKASKARSEGDERGSFMGYSEDGNAITETEVPEEIIERALRG